MKTLLIDTPYGYVDEKTDKSIHRFLEIYILRLYPDQNVSRKKEGLNSLEHTKRFISAHQRKEK